MKQQTKKVLGVVAISVLTLGIGQSVYARGGYGWDGQGWDGQGWDGQGWERQGWQGRGCDGAGPRGMRGPGGRMGGYGKGMGFADPAATAQRLEQLKTGLAITPEQEQAWSQYATAVTNRAAVRNAHREARFNGTLTPEQIQDYRQSRQTQREQMFTARHELYAALSTEQRATAAKLMTGPGHQGRGW